MKRLIINADDFGLTEGINNGISDCYKKGAIKDISLIADSNAYEHAVGLAKKNNIKNIGAHIVLSEETDPRRKYYKFPWRYFLGTISDKDIYANVKNQISKIKNSGFDITHLNSHQHIHMVPRILKVFIRLAKEFSVKFIRFPYEAKIFNFFDCKNTLRVFSLRSMCVLSKGILIKSGIKHNDYFYGHFYSGNLNREKLSRVLSNIEEGITELTCHIGYLTDEIRLKYAWHRNCEKELMLFSDPRFLDEVNRRNIELISYAQA